MLEKFKEYLKLKFEINKSAKILLAISGGADSIVMLDMFAKLDFNCGIAHCNFHLRGKDSNNDETFVNKLAQKHSFPFFKKDFQTKQLAGEKGISIEMAARELRYAWFEKIREKYGYQFIAVAHHQDDVIETFFINLTRGTGIRGLSGIKEINGNIIRPLLFLNREQIHKYIKEYKLDYREDITNKDTDIIRNKFRHQIIPLLAEVNPAVSKNILQTIENLRSAELIMTHKLADVKKKLKISDNEPVKINIKELKKFEPINIYLFEILKSYGFNISQIRDVEESLNTESGKSFYSKSHLVVKDRSELIITKIEEENIFPMFINEVTTKLEIRNKQSMILKKVSRDKDFRIPKESNFVAIDFDKLRFPLQLRGWETGNYFYPLGMNKRKKISDFFIDEKLSLIEKQNSMLLLSDNEVVWVVNKRIDNRFKITDNTQTILLIKFIEE